MRIAMIGLGRMGMGLTERLIQHGHEVVAFDLNPQSVLKASEAGADAASSIAEAVKLLGKSPRVVWIMVPAGRAVDSVLETLKESLSAGDIVIDGGNSYYRDSMRRADDLAARHVHFLDTGVSGGIWGLEEGFNLMTGGDSEAFAVVEPVFRALAPEGGYAHVGPSGAGHFVKMVHNGIEYGMMQAIAEGFELIAAKREFQVDLHKLARLWQRGSVIRSWLLDLTGNALEIDPDLGSLAPFVQDSGEGRWTIEESLQLSVPMPVTVLSLQMRYRSRQENSFASRMLAALRNQFGGHAVKRRQEEGDAG